MAEARKHASKGKGIGQKRLLHILSLFALEWNLDNLAYSDLVDREREFAEIAENRAAAMLQAAWAGRQWRKKTAAVRSTHANQTMWRAVNFTYVRTWFTACAQAAPRA